MKRIFLAAALSLSFAVPAAAAGDVASELRQLTETTDLSGVAMSPDGAWVAWRQERASVERNDYVLDWYVMPVDGSQAPRRVADGGGALLSEAGMLSQQHAYWSEDSRQFYFRALIDGEVQVWRAARDGTAAQRVTADGANVQTFRLDPATGRLLYTGGATRDEIVRAETDEYDKGVRIDGSRDVSLNLFRGTWIEGRLATKQWVGGWFRGAGLLHDRPVVQKLLEPGATEARVAEASDIAAFERFPSADPAWGESVAISKLDGRFAKSVKGKKGAKDGKGGILVAADKEFKDPVTCREEECLRADAVAWRSGRAEIVFSTHDHAQVHSLFRWDLAQNRVIRIVEGDGLMSSGRERDSSCAVGAANAVCITTAPARPPRLERIDLDSGARTVLAEPNAAPPTVQVERLDWQDAAGRKFSGQLFLPQGVPAGRPAPLFINYYICDGYLRGGTGDEWPLAAMARNGIAALCITKAGGRPGPHDAVAEYKDGLSGVESAIQLLQKRGVVDPANVGQGGLSFGSETTMWVLMRSNLLAAASIASIELEPIYYWVNGHAGRTIHDMLHKAWGLGDPVKTAERWKLVSPALNTDKIRAPLLMQLPEQEMRFNGELYAKLSNSTTPVELYGFPNEPHIKYQPRHKLVAYERNLDWFRFWLQGYEDPAPEKAAQYVRWRSMRLKQEQAGVVPGKGLLRGG